MLVDGYLPQYWSFFNVAVGLCALAEHAKSDAYVQLCKDHRTMRW